MAGWTCLDAETNEWDGTIKADRLIGDGSKITNIPSVPVGTIVMFGGANAPDGWLLCWGTSLLRADYLNLYNVIGTTFGSADGTHFNLPDFAGIFPRGAGTSSKLSNANGTAFSGTLGTYQNDKLQGHWHKQRDITGGVGTNWGLNMSSVIVGIVQPAAVKEAVDDGTNGTTRTGNETNPANLSVNFIIKY